MSDHSIPNVDGPDETDARGSAPTSSVNWEKLDALLDDLPPGIPVLAPEDAGKFDKYTHRPRHVYAAGDGWKNCVRVLKKYDADLCKAYREEIDTLLVFAGLFSAVVTTFTIESYQWLQTDADDTIVLMLSQIALSVSVNSTAPPPSPAPQGLADSVSVRINAYWFLALALSLSAALVAILCKQWIREFERNVGLCHQEFVAVHHTKMEGLENWGVGGMVSLLPLVLQLALALFALGVLELLWQLNRVVGAIVCVPAIFAFLFYLATTLLPVIQYVYLITREHSSARHLRSIWHRLSQCPYKSPQAKIAFQAYFSYLSFRSRLVLTVSSAARILSMARWHLLIRLGLSCRIDVPDVSREPGPGRSHIVPWHILDLWINSFLNRAYGTAESPEPGSLHQSSRWLSMYLGDSDIREWICHCLWEMAHYSRPNCPPSHTLWLQRELHFVETGSMEAPRCGRRALALGYLARMHRSMFAVEAYIQHLSSIDPASAEYLTRRLASMVITHVSETNGWLDPRVAVTSIRVASDYVRSHVRESLGVFIFNLSEFLIRAANLQQRGVLSTCTLSLYLHWLRAQHVPHQPATIETTERMAWLYCSWFHNDLTSYGTRLERLRRLPGVLELAELLNSYVQMRMPTDLPAVFTTGRFSPSLLTMERLISELLEIARRDTGHGDAVSGVRADNSPPRSRTPRESLIAVHPLPDSLSGYLASCESEEAPTMPPSTRRSSAHDTMSPVQPQRALTIHVHDLEETEAENSVCRCVAGVPGPHESPIQRSAVTQGPSNGHAKRLPRRDFTEDALPVDGERNAKTRGGDRRLNESGGSAGSSGSSESHRSAALHATVIHSTPGICQQRLFCDDPSEAICALTAEKVGESTETTAAWTYAYKTSDMAWCRKHSPD